MEELFVWYDVGTEVNAETAFGRLLPLVEFPAYEPMKIDGNPIGALLLDVAFWGLFIVNPIPLKGSVSFENRPHQFDCKKYVLALPPFAEIDIPLNCPLTVPAAVDVSVHVAGPVPVSGAPASPPDEDPDEDPEPEPLDDPPDPEPLSAPDEPELEPEPEPLPLEPLLPDVPTGPHAKHATPTRQTTFANDAMGFTPTYVELRACVSSRNAAVGDPTT
jgi:hypothetical protein